MTYQEFTGDFGFLAFGAGVLHGAVPYSPTSNDFQNFAASHSDTDEVCSMWHLEAIRSRRQTPGCDLNREMRAINRRVASRIYSKLQELN